MENFEIPPYFKIKSALEFDNDIKYNKYQVLYIIIRHLFPEVAYAKNSQINKTYVQKFNLKKLEFPLTFNGLQKLIKKNKHLPINVNVLYDAEGTISNLGLISNKKNNKGNVLHLLMFKTDTSNDSTDFVFQKFDKNKKLKIKPQNHFFYKIKNIQKLLNYRDYILSKKKLKNAQRNSYCEKCFLRFRSKTKMITHYKTCVDNQNLIYPKKGARLAFSNVTHSSKVPVLGFCDFESVLQRNSERSHCKQCNKDECQCNASKTQNVDQHRPIGYSIMFVDSNNEVFFEEAYAGVDCVKHFFERLKHYEKIVEAQKQIFREVYHINATPEEWELFHETEECYICKKPFSEANFKMKKVVDHDHVTSKILGAAHSICNFKRQSPYYTTIFFHNAQG